MCLNDFNTYSKTETERFRNLQKISELCKERNIIFLDTKLTFLEEENDLADEP